MTIAQIQALFTKDSHLYKITKDIDLQGGTITLPSKSILDFSGGGTISNGSIVLNNTTIINSANSAIFTDITFTGSCINDYICVEWFKDSTFGQQLQDSVKLAKLTPKKTVYLISDKYVLDSEVNLISSDTDNNYISIQGRSYNTTVILDTAGTLIGKFNKVSNIKFLASSSNVWEQPKHGYLFKNSYFSNGESNPVIEYCFIAGQSILFKNCNFSGRSTIQNCVLYGDILFSNCQLGDCGISNCYIHGNQQGVQYTPDNTVREFSKFGEESQFTMFNLSDCWIEFMNMGGNYNNLGSRSYNCVYDYCYNIGFPLIGCLISNCDYTKITENFAKFAPTGITFLYAAIAIFDTSSIQSCIFQNTQLDKDTYLFTGHYDDDRSSFDNFKMIGCSGYIPYSSTASMNNLCYNLSILNLPFYSNSNYANQRIELPYTVNTTLPQPMTPGLICTIQNNGYAISKSKGTFNYWTREGEDSVVFGYALDYIADIGFSLTANNTWLQSSPLINLDAGSYIYSIELIGQYNANFLNLQIVVNTDKDYSNNYFTTTSQSELTVKVKQNTIAQFILVKLRVYKFTGNVTDVGSLSNKKSIFSIGQSVIKNNKLAFWDGSKWIDSSGTVA